MYRFYVQITFFIDMINILENLSGTLIVNLLKTVRMQAHDDSR